MTDLPERGSTFTPENTAASEIPREVASAGVKAYPTTVPIPKPVQQMGVAPGPANIPTPAATVTLPITDDQIAQGLGKSITESFRWLAEWCIRRLKQAHMGLKYIQGKIVRTSYAK